EEAGVHLVAGDTKVAGKGQVDGVFITTAGVGEMTDGVSLSGRNAKPGDAIIVTGDVGRHGCAILLA
ncbi:MAG TPA: hydrogenase expression/formation protein HypE, partial [Lachnospiraceae bacterium]|nr:hydrogenase expression/formation protein HypE [Lachnospiraceae bacterium]